MSAATRTTCPYCGVGCGVVATRNASGGFDIAGDPLHPANGGRLCSKGSALGETLALDGRLLHPEIHGERVSWQQALDHVAMGFKRIIDEHGPDAVAFYVSGQLLTEDYYVANKLMKGFIGSANIDTNSRLCMSSAVAGHKRAFGEDIVPTCYEDLEFADLIVLVGSNTAWCHPVVFQRIARAREERPNLKIVVIDPRRTPTSEFADLHVPLRAGTDVWLFNGLLAWLRQHAHTAHDFVDRHTLGLDRALLVAENTAGDVRSVARACRVDESLVAEFFALFAGTERVVTIFSQGVNQSSAGTDKVNSIINCHLLTGRIGKPGTGPFSITGQPNAMGGREVGGLANMLAAHLDLDNEDHRTLVQRFWNSPRIADKQGLKAVDLFDAIHDRSVKAVWIMATNPVVSLPDADKVKEALRRCELVVVSDCVRDTDTNALAHVLLPAAGWGEKNGTVTNSERRISRQRAFMDVPGDARPDWWIISEVAKRLGRAPAFSYTSVHDVFREHAALSAEGNDGTRAFDIGGLAGLDPREFDALDPIQWPVTAAHRHGTARLGVAGRFFHAGGKARFVPTTPRMPLNATDAEYPLVLNTGRVRDQWHTMTRTGMAPRLTSHIAEPYVDLHAQDALLAGTRAGELVRVTSRWGSVIARLRISGETPRGMVFMPIHWSAAFSSDARVGAVVNPIVDPISGEPELKHTPARVSPFVVSWFGFILSRTPLENLDVTWWSLARGDGFLRYEIAGRRVHGDRSRWARRIFKVGTDADWLEYSDIGTGVFRGALLQDNRVVACVFISARPDLPSRTWLAGLFAKEQLSDADRAGVLTGRAVDAGADTGPIVCSCFGVGRGAIEAAIEERGLTTTLEVGKAVKAGTNCGSCVSEIRMLLASSQARRDG